MKKILVINLGSTSSELAYCENESIRAKKSWQNDETTLKSMVDKEDILRFRRGLVESFIADNAIDMSTLDAIAARGSGRSGRYRHGAYLLSPELGEEVRRGRCGHQGLFASTVIADELSQQFGCPAYLYDVVPTDEVYDVARICGIPDYRRVVHSHTLNGRATARLVAEQMGLDPDHSTFIVCHMGGGTGTMCYKDGVIVDTYSAEEGAFTPIRAGRVPADYLVKLYSNADMLPGEIQYHLKKKVGLYGHLGTGDCREVERRIAAGDEKARLVYEAMAYQLSKDIGAMATVAGGKVHAIILTGGVAHSRMITNWISERVGFIAPVQVIPGSMEIEALAGGVTRVLTGIESVNDYSLV